MDYSKLANQFIEEGKWEGLPTVSVRLFAKWLEEKEVAQENTQNTKRCEHKNTIPNLPSFVECLDCGYTVPRIEAGKETT